MNPMQMIMQMINSGNPMNMMRQIAVQNPIVGRALQMMEGKTPEQLKQMAYNMAQEAGTTPEQIARNFGIRM
jgi:hypothetical protein